ncbi:MAG TPA: RNA polymerase sigma factor [Terriglobia bacterium]|nr:RNA polymerase sigma factor [Terriglobia bacterium]
MPGDHELWSKLSRGDVAAFEGFFRAHAPRLRSFLRVYLPDSQAAEDVAQETFLQLWKHPNGYNPSRSSLKSYVFGIARKRAADWWRRHPTSGERSTERPVLGEGFGVLVKDAFDQLDSDSRSVLWLREVEGYSYEELAQILDIPMGTVKSRLFTAREELRRVWKSGN